jgi:ABC-type amino acid transport substrate-binding protein
MSLPSRSGIKSVLAFTLLSLLIAALASGCGGASSSSSSSSTASAGTEESTTGSGPEGETLTVGSDIPYPPFEQGKPGSYTGLDVELMEAIGEKIGRPVGFQDTSFETIFVQLDQGQFDVIASAATITPEREKTVDFSNPYYLNEQAVLVKAGSSIKSFADLEGKIVGVQKGSTGQEYAEAKASASEVRPYPTGPDAFNSLNAGTVEAVLIDIPAAEHVAEVESGLEVSASVPTGEQFGFVVAQGEAQLLEEINKGLKETEEDGTYAKIYEKWIHRAPPKAIFSATHTAE